jgi:hypothetical protein
MMAKPGNLCARSVDVTMASTDVRNVLAGAFIVRHVLSSSIYLILCIGLRYVLMHAWMHRSYKFLSNGMALSSREFPCANLG